MANGTSLPPTSRGRSSAAHHTICPLAAGIAAISKPAPGPSRTSGPVLPSCPATCRATCPAPVALPTPRAASDFARASRRASAPRWQCGLGLGFSLNEWCCASIMPCLAPGIQAGALGTSRPLRGRLVPSDAQWASRLPALLAGACAGNARVCDLPDRTVFDHRTPVESSFLSELFGFSPPDEP